MTSGPPGCSYYYYEYKDTLNDYVYVYQYIYWNSDTNPSTPSPCSSTYRCICHMLSPPPPSVPPVSPLPPHPPPLPPAPPRPPALPPLSPGWLMGNGVVMQTSGKCDTPITEVSQCSAAAVSLGITGYGGGALSTPSLVSYSYSSYYPHGCSFSVSTDSSLALGFYAMGLSVNSHDPAAAAACDTYYYCLCTISSPPPPPVPPLPPHPPPLPPAPPRPPALPPLSPGWLMGNGVVMQTSGKCDTPITEVSKCSAAAVSLGITGYGGNALSPTSSVDDSYYPHGCIFSVYTDSSLALGFAAMSVYVNSHDPATAAACGNFYCLCAISSPPPPSPPPLPPSPPSPPAGPPAPPLPPPLPPLWLIGPTVMMRLSGKCEIPITTVEGCTEAAKELGLKGGGTSELYAYSSPNPPTNEPSGCVLSDPPTGYYLNVNGNVATGDCSPTRGCLCGLPNVPPSPRPPPLPPPPSPPPSPPAPLQMIATAGGVTYEIKAFGRCSRYLTTKIDCVRALAAFGFVIYPQYIYDSPYSYSPPCAHSGTRLCAPAAELLSAPPLVCFPPCFPLSSLPPSYHSPYPLPALVSRLLDLRQHLLNSAVRVVDVFQPTRVVPDVWEHVLVHLPGRCTLATSAPNVSTVAPSATHAATVTTVAASFARARVRSLCGRPHGRVGSWQGAHRARER